MDGFEKPLENEAIHSFVRSFVRSFIHFAVSGMKCKQRYNANPPKTGFLNVFLIQWIVAH